MVKSTLLDILLLRASGWKAEEEDEQETGSEFIEGEVFAEDDVTEEQEQEGTDDQDDSKGKTSFHSIKFSFLITCKKNILTNKFSKFIRVCCRH